MEPPWGARGGVRGTQEGALLGQAYIPSGEVSVCGPGTQGPNEPVPAPAELTLSEGKRVVTRAARGDIAGALTGVTQASVGAREGEGPHSVQALAHIVPQVRDGRHREGLGGRLSPTQTRRGTAPLPRGPWRLWGTSPCDYGARDCEWTTLSAEF